VGSAPIGNGGQFKQVKILWRSNKFPDQVRGILVKEFLVISEIPIPATNMQAVHLRTELFTIHSSPDKILIELP
jgi:hypothetical protein